MAPEDPSREAKREDKLAQPYELSETVSRLRALTPARLLAGRSGAAYRTNTQMELREAHAAARDAVRAELNLLEDFGEVFVRKWNLLEVCSQATSKEQHIMRPDLGRRLNEASRMEVIRHCATGRDLQVAIGDGLSVTALGKQIPRLLPLICGEATNRGWIIGSIFVIRHCRVGILNEIGELLRPRVALLLIGERPGLATAEGISAYMAYRPKSSDTDANRNLISNIHAGGVSTASAAQRILSLAALMMKTNESGFQLREELPHEFLPPPSLDRSPVPDGEGSSRSVDGQTSK